MTDANFFIKKIEDLETILSEAASMLSLPMNGIALNRRDCNELWRRCMIALGFSEAELPKSRAPKQFIEPLPDGDDPVVRECFEDTVRALKMSSKMQGNIYTSTYTQTGFELTFGTINRLRNLAMQKAPKVEPPAAGMDALLDWLYHYTWIYPDGSYHPDRPVARPVGQKIDVREMPDVVLGSAPIDLDATVTRFLNWRLPNPFSPDGSISFTPPTNPDWWPIGTNLFDADQAKAMFEHCIVSVPKAAPATHPEPTTLHNDEPVIGWSNAAPHAEYIPGTKLGPARLPTDAEFEEANLKVQQEIWRQLLQTMILSSVQIVDGEEVIGYEIKTGALHKLVGMAPGVFFPMGLPSRVVAKAATAVDTGPRKATSDNGNLWEIARLAKGAVNAKAVYGLCPVGCGCLWTNNFDGSMSLGANQRSCEVCEHKPFSELIHLFAAPVKGSTDELSDAAKRGIAPDSAWPWETGL